MNVTRMQHYVWRHYLEAWEIDGKLQVCRNHSHSFQSAAGKIARQRDFYRIPHLQAVDLEFIRSNIDAMGLSDEEKDVAYGWVRPWEILQKIEDRTRGRPVSAEIRKGIEFYRNQAEEMIHSEIEDDAVRTLKSLREGDCSFWMSAGEQAPNFAFFVALQLLRTKRMATRLVADVPMQDAKHI